MQQVCLSKFQYAGGRWRRLKRVWIALTLHLGGKLSRQAYIVTARLPLSRPYHNFPHMTAAPSQQELNSLAAACQRLWTLDVNGLQPGQDYDLNPQVDCTSRLARD